ncbi:uncharacterized protein STEHIDRAFT_122262 [Stereum hirsutum FP-91666 SS1]|uniref:uncharacterized protein n=1 Tax=Stereum hirsutum (strain FP-91666) TaxID=721885 RepID=UPI0004449480|nr:uncharacterized protein STEHIDRAFT_122262 [Stereum hirsutum FP-91666 SS1]EIM85278.1 hypothetical protein STEHIDRAFT_122262 [Stereum hirsutum FP-91666 SS1]
MSETQLKPNSSTRFTTAPTPTPALPLHHRLLLLRRLHSLQQVHIIVIQPLTIAPTSPPTRRMSQTRRPVARRQRRKRIVLIHELVHVHIDIVIVVILRHPFSRTTISYGSNTDTHTSTPLLCLFCFGPIHRRRHLQIDIQVQIMPVPVCGLTYITS